MELFFDLVYVFAITQLSEFLGRHLSARGALQALVLFGAVWWAWNYTAWATNWIDPDRRRVALLMIVLTGISLVRSASIPEAFGSRGLAFAVSYVAIQVLRSGFMVAALRGGPMGGNYAQLLAWSAISGIVWIADALAPGDARLWLWIAALVLDLGAPLHGFRLPGVPGTPIEAWTLALRGRQRVRGRFVTVSLWAIYYLHHAEEGARSMAVATGAATRMGRSGYAYAHAIMVAGVVVVAVGIRLTRAPGSAITGVVPRSFG